MQNDDEILKEYFSCLYNQQNGNNEPMQRFKLSFPKEYGIINGMYHKRVKLAKILDFMNSLGKVYFGCLTFNDEQNSKDEPTKRKQAWRHLNNIFKVVVMVEEYGSINDRYHIHFMGVFRDGKTFFDFFKWHSKTDIEMVKSKRKVTRYLCDYIAKQVPKIRQNQALICGMRHYLKSKSWKNHGFHSFATDEMRLSTEVVDSISALV